MNVELDAIPDVFAKFAEQTAFCDDELRVSYRSLQTDVCRRCTHLRSLGFDLGDRVVWSPGTDYDSLVTFWSLFALGTVACPVSSRFPAATVQRLCQSLDAKPLPEKLHHAVVSDIEDVWKSKLRDCFSCERPATMILSSGSTGQPKIIGHTLLSHVLNALGAQSRIPLGVGDRWLWSLPTYHVSGLSILIRCALAGATICSSARGLETQVLRDFKITHLSAVTTQLKRLLSDEGFQAGSLKAILVGGSAVDEATVQSTRRLGIGVHTTYGMTEAASQITTSTTTDDPRSSGSLLPYRELMVDDAGEILVRGQTLCCGYWQQGRFIAATDDDGWLHTGDLGFVRDRQLYVTGRIDNMFVSGGENVHPEAIERAMSALEGVQQVVVVARKDDQYGARPVAFVRGEFDVTSDWRDQLAQRLRSFEIPVSVCAWPAAADAAIKPNRALLSRLANGHEC